MLVNMNEMNTSMMNINMKMMSEVKWNLLFMEFLLYLFVLGGEEGITSKVSRYSTVLMPAYSLLKQEQLQQLVQAFVMTGPSAAHPDPMSIHGHP